MRLSTLIIIFCMGAGLTVLCSLGSWQVQRLYWKEALIERVNSRVKLEPVPLNDVVRGDITRDDHEYTPVMVSGEFNYKKEVYFFTTDKKGASGWNVHSPMKLDDGKVLIVNRGFIYFSEKNNQERLQAIVPTRQNIEGLIRVPSITKPGSLPDNVPQKSEFYWRDLPAIYDAMDVPSAERLPIILDMNEIAVPEGWPKGSTTIISFTNNHLGYAITWFGLALTLLGVGGFFLYSRARVANKNG